MTVSGQSPDACNPSWIPCGPSQGGCGTIIRVSAMPISGSTERKRPHAATPSLCTRILRVVRDPRCPFGDLRSPPHGPPGRPFVRNRNSPGRLRTRTGPAVRTGASRARGRKDSPLCQVRRGPRHIRPGEKKMCGPLPACRTVLAGSPRRGILQYAAKRSTCLSGRRSRRMVSNDELEEAGLAFPAWTRVIREGVFRSALLYLVWPLKALERSAKL